MQYSEQRHKEHTTLSILRYRLDHDQTNRLLWDIYLTGATVEGEDTLGFAGTITAYIDEANKRADMGIMIFPIFSGMGYGAEAWKLVMEHVFTRVPTIFAGMMASNRGMRRICEKAFMCECGRIPGYFVLNDKREDAIFYRKDK